MIKQQLFFNDKLILTIFHEGIDTDLEGRLIDELENTGFGELRFIEEKVDRIKLDKYDEVNKVFLENKNKKNPYNSYSANLIEFIRYDKPFFLDGELDQSVLDMNKFIKICDFIEKKTGFKVREYPYSVGNTLIFIPNKIECEFFRQSNDISGIEVNGLNNDNVTIIKLKNFNEIRKVYILKGSECIVHPEYDWDSCDIEVYDKNNIVYAIYDVSLMKKLSIKMNVVSKIIKTELKTERKQINIKSSSEIPIETKEENISNLKKYFEEEAVFLSELKNSQYKETIFLGKNESKKAFEAFEKIMDIKSDEIWIFDPYFIDYNTTGGVEKLRDIIKILSKNRNIKKKIVFETKENISLDTFIDKISNKEIKEIKEKIQGLNIELIETKEHFHDRFFFIREKDNIHGYLIGTSLNSFGKNYSTLLKLNEYDAKFIFNKLENEVVTNKIINKKEL